MVPGEIRYLNSWSDDFLINLHFSQMLEYMFIAFILMMRMLYINTYA